VTRATMLMLLALALAACGKPGPPEPPRPDQYPQIYPKQEALPPGEQVPNIPIPQGPNWEGDRGY
jgi:hypothetical protein